MEVVNLEDKFERFSEHWKPKILARLNDYHGKAVKLKGEFVWHKQELRVTPEATDGFAKLAKLDRPGDQVPKAM